MNSITCYPCKSGLFVVPHACSLPPSCYKPAPLSTLANQWREREDDKALAKSAEQVAYVLRMIDGTEKSFTTVPAAIRAAVKMNQSKRLFMVRWWPRTPAGELAANAALVWVSQKSAGYTDIAQRYEKEKYARTLTGPKCYAEMEIPL